MTGKQRKQLASPVIVQQRIVTGRILQRRSVGILHYFIDVRDVGGAGGRMGAGDDAREVGDDEAGQGHQNGQDDNEFDQGETALSRAAIMEVLLCFHFFFIVSFVRAPPKPVDEGHPKVFLPV